MEPFTLISIHSDSVGFYCFTAIYRPLIDTQADAWSMYTPSLAKRIFLFRPSQGDGLKRIAAAISALRGVKGGLKRTA